MYKDYKAPKGQRIVRAVVDIGSHRRLTPLFRQIVEQAAEERVIDPLSQAICKGVSALSLVPCALLAMFLCRYSELQSLSFKDLVERKKISFIQAKTGAAKNVSTSIFYENLHTLDEYEAIPLQVVSYKALASEIRRAVKRNRITLPGHALKETHIFRHLYASWALHQGVPDKDVAKKLGHNTIGAIKAYQHPWRGMQSVLIS